MSEIEGYLPPQTLEAQYAAVDEFMDFVKNADTKDLVDSITEKDLQPARATILWSELGFRLIHIEDPADSETVAAKREMLGEAISGRYRKQMRGAA